MKATNEQEQVMRRMIRVMRKYGMHLVFHRLPDRIEVRVWREDGREARRSIREEDCTQPPLTAVCGAVGALIAEVC
jgi:hypothetical protein